ncbi:hypothetical protein [Nonomuraea africana]|uniref:Uncharacterized protein n=1 Tax=Nonomuraea africana TaxID=46171 RepID=A0ABR9KUK5_9ACTN|nr:hypothetical protein [Nonomuraea africana]MBE1565715.1 hypothetical protein [Nonomuraea africana]
MIPEFDPKRTRRAVRLGILRTATAVLAVLLVVSLAVVFGSRLIQERGNRERRMVDVLGTALQVANPGYVIGEKECCDISLTGMSFSVHVSPLQARGGFFAGAAVQTLRVEQDFFGRVQSPPLGYATETRLTYGLYDVGTGNQPKQDMRQVLARLPEGLTALTVVELSRPLKETEFAAFRKRTDLYPERVVYENRPRSTPITWSAHQIGAAFDQDDNLASFRAWVASLRAHDEHNLRQFGLDLARLKKSAADGLTYAFVTSRTVGDLRKLIDDPDIKTIRVADVTYDLERP